MPKEKTSTRALTGSRIMHKPIPSCIATFTGSNVWAATNGWETVSNKGLFYETYFDLSGYELDDLTLIPVATLLQDGMPYTTTSVDPVTQLAVFDVISQERLSPEEVIDAYGATAEYPGSPGSTEDWTQILMCNFRLMSPQTDFAVSTLLLPATGGSFGSAEPTAVQKLWLYRIVRPAALDLSATTWSIPPTNFVLNAEIIEEPTLDYMMRLKRSYELQG